MSDSILVILPKLASNFEAVRKVERKTGKHTGIRNTDKIKQEKLPEGAASSLVYTHI